MKIGAPKESAPGEAYVALTPESAKQIQKLGQECLVESGAGVASGFDDEAFADLVAGRTAAAKVILLP